MVYQIKWNLKKKKRQEPLELSKTRKFIDKSYNFIERNIDKIAIASVGITIVSFAVCSLTTNKAVIGISNSLGDTKLLPQKLNTKGVKNGNQRKK